MNYEPLYTFAEKHRVPYNELCTALRAALAAPQPEPLGYVSITGHGTYFRITITPELAALEQGGRKMWTPVVAAPPAAPAPAVPLTDEQFADIVAEASLEVDLAANPLKLLAFARAVLSAAPVVPTISPLALRALRMADMALASWENGYAFDSHGPGREAQRLVTDALALSAAPVVREPQYWCPETGELCGKCAKTGTCEASILQAHGIGGGGK